MHFPKDKVTSFVELEGLELGDFMNLIKEKVGIMA